MCICVYIYIYTYTYISYLSLSIYIYIYMLTHGILYVMYIVGTRRDLEGDVRQWVDSTGPIPITMYVTLTSLKIEAFSSDPGTG